MYYNIELYGIRHAYRSKMFVKYNNQQVIQFYSFHIYVLHWSCKRRCQASLQCTSVLKSSLKLRTQFPKCDVLRMPCFGPSICIMYAFDHFRMFEIRI